MASSNINIALTTGRVYDMRDIRSLISDEYYTCSIGGYKVMVYSTLDELIGGKELPEDFSVCCDIKHKRGPIVIISSDNAYITFIDEDHEESYMSFKGKGVGDLAILTTIHAKMATTRSIYPIDWYRNWSEEQKEKLGPGFTSLYEDAKSKLLLADPSSPLAIAMGSIFTKWRQELEDEVAAAEVQ